MTQQFGQAHQHSIGRVDVPEHQRADAIESIEEEVRIQLHLKSHQPRRAQSTLQIHHPTFPISETLGIGDHVSDGHHDPVDQHVEEEGRHQDVADEVMERFFGAVLRKEPLTDAGTHEDPNQRKHRAADTVERQPHAPMIATQVEAPPQLERRYRQQRKHIPIGQRALDGYRPGDPLSERGRLQVVLPSKGEPYQGPTQSIQQRKPPLAAGRRRNLGIHARNSAAPAASGNAHSSVRDRKPPPKQHPSGLPKKQKAPLDRSRRAFKVVRTAGLGSLRPC